MRNSFDESGIFGFCKISEIRLVDMDFSYFHAAVVDRVYKVNFPSEHGYGDVRPYFKQTLREAFFV